MPRGPRGESVLYVRLPRETRDAVARAASEQGISINAWCARALHEATHHATRHDTTQHATRCDATQDTPHDATHDTPGHHTPLVTVVDVIRSITEGRPLIAPCGRPWPCTETEGTTTVAGQDYCRTCNVRVH